MLKEAVRQEPSADNYANRAGAYLADEQFDKVISDLDEVIRLKPGVSSFICRAEVYMVMEKYDETKDI